ncbi:30S ribosomal protein S9 [sediment metagenome]|uniref:30S ribosomal protein S9 n=1 Tax=sediment metagenome TaxID=749907 RepID=D9PK59_9ZZZZ
MADKKFRNTVKSKKKQVLAIVKEKIAKIIPSKKKYTETLGRRKTATARVRLYPASKMEFNVNGKSLDDFFGTAELRKKVIEALDLTKEKYLVVAFVKGSGITGQAEAIRLGISRALVKINSEVRGELKAKGFLKRDPRSVERKKPGLKKARKAPT